MPVYKAPLRDTRFLLNEVFDFPSITATWSTEPKPRQTWSMRSSANARSSARK